MNLIKQPVCDKTYRLLAGYNSNESSAFTHICKFPSRYNLAYSSGSSTASEVNAQSKPGVVFKSFSASDSFQIAIAIGAMRNFPAPYIKESCVPGLSSSW